MFLGKFVGNTFGQNIVPERIFGFRSVFGSQDLIFALATLFYVFQHAIDYLPGFADWRDALIEGDNRDC